MLFYYSSNVGSINNSPNRTQIEILLKTKYHPFSHKFFSHFFLVFTSVSASKRLVHIETRDPRSRYVSVLCLICILETRNKTEIQNPDIKSDLNEIRWKNQILHVKNVDDERLRSAMRRLMYLQFQAWLTSLSQLNSNKIRKAYLAWSQVANSGISAVNRRLLHDAVSSRVSVAGVLGPHTVLPIEHTPET